ncbi:hypothetical protein B0H14DRAFT_3594955 [Mycena olivaceomarginata]|nr:hypothetical protein B0H14DRAFT_3594955 [Mycena olivaceomarginata]
MPEAWSSYDASASTRPHWRSPMGGARHIAAAAATDDEPGERGSAGPRRAAVAALAATSARIISISHHVLPTLYYHLVLWIYRPALSILVIGVRFEARGVFLLCEDRPSKTPEETTTPRIRARPAMYDYYADYDDYDDRYDDNSAGYDPPEASYDTYEPHYDVEPETELYNVDYPAYEDGGEDETELVEQEGWDEPRSEDVAHGWEPPDDAPALDVSYAAWQETWAAGPAPDEDEDAWVQAMDCWREQIEACHGADAREDLAYASLPDHEIKVGDDAWTSPERDQLQEAFERGLVSDVEYVRVLGELRDEQLELEQLDRTLRADGYFWDKECDDYVHPVYGCASLVLNDNEASHGADAGEDLAYANVPGYKSAVGDDSWISPERDQLQEAFQRGAISDEEYFRVLGGLRDEQLELERLDERLRADGYIWDEGCDDYVHPVYGRASLGLDDDVALPPTPPDHMHLVHSVAPPPVPAVRTVRTSRPYRLAHGPRLGQTKPACATHSLRTPQPQTQYIPRRRQRRLRTHSPRSRARDSPPHLSVPAPRTRAGSDPGPRLGKLKPPDGGTTPVTVLSPIPSAVSILPTTTQPQAKASLRATHLCVDTVILSKSRKPPNIGEIYRRTAALSTAGSAPPSPLSSSPAPTSELDQRRYNALRRLSKKGMTSSPRGGRAACFRGGGGGPFGPFLAFFCISSYLTHSLHSAPVSFSGSTARPSPPPVL